MTDRPALLEDDLPFRTIVQHAAIGVGLVGADGTILHANPRLGEMFGCDAALLTGRTIAGVTHPDDRDADLAHFDELVRGVRASYVMEKRYRRDDGRYFIGRLTASLVRDASGAVQYAIGMVEDITELRNLSHAIGERVKELNALHSLSRRLLAARNEDVPSLLRFVAELLPPAMQFPEMAEARVQIGVDHVATRGFAHGHPTLRSAWAEGDTPAGCIEVQYTGVAPGAAEGPFLEEERALLDSIADLLRTATLAMRESIERDRAEQALRLSEERLRVAHNAARVGIIEWDVNNDVATISDMARQIFDFPEGTTNVTIPEVRSRIHPDDVELVRQSFRGEERTEQGAHREYRVVWRDGSIHWVSVRGHFFFDDDGQPIRRMSVFVDVTGHHQLEEEFRHAQKMEAVGRLAGGVAHDFNNLLTVIGAAAEFAHQATEPGTQLRSDVQDIADAVNRARALTSQLLTFSRRQVVRTAWLDLGDVVRHTEKMLRRLVGADVALAMSPATVPVPVRADAGQLEQVLVNLVVNARDAMPKGGTVSITTSIADVDETVMSLRPELSPGRYALLTVSDTGTGMDEETRARMFDPFFTTKEAGKGTGLGLSTVFGIVKQAGGHIVVYSEMGIGTTFRIYLPLTASESASAAETFSMPARPLGGHETVLLVEDEPHVRLLARRILVEHGYTVIEAGSGREAIEIGAEHSGPLHLLLSDVVLPERHGGEVAEELLAARPGLRVLFMSGYTADALLHHRITEAGTPFIEKPFTRSGLAAAVRETLDRKPA